jgi:hypothetical protein
MVHFKVISVSRHSSLEVTTTHYTFEKSGRKSGKREEKGEWEEIVLRLNLEDNPIIQVGHSFGDIAMDGTGDHDNLKLRLNNPKLFGTFKVGDIASLEVLNIPRNEKEEPK